MSAVALALLQQIDGVTLQRGRAYSEGGRVLTVVGDLSFGVRARVQGTRRQPYQVFIKAQPEGAGRASLQSICSCPMTCACKHVAAVLYTLADSKTVEQPPARASRARRAERWPPAGRDAAARRADGRSVGRSAAVQVQGKPRAASPPERLSADVDAWLDRVATASRALAAPQPAARSEGAAARDTVLYLLQCQQQAGVAIVTSRPRKRGGWCKPTRVHPEALFSSYGPSRLAAFGSQDDQELIVRLWVHRQGYVYNQFALSGEHGAAALERLLATGRCYAQDLEGSPLRRGPERRGTVTWHTDDGLSYRLTCQIDPQAELVLGPSPPYYRDGATFEVGPLSVSVPPPVLRLVRDAPRVRAQELDVAAAAMARALPAGLLPAPPKRPIERRRTVAPVPCVELDVTQLHDLEGDEIEIDVARLSFDYDGIKAAYSAPDAALVRRRGDTIETIRRDLEAEAKAAEALRTCGWITTAEAFGIDRSTRSSARAVGERCAGSWEDDSEDEWEDESDDEWDDLENAWDDDSENDREDQTRNAAPPDTIANEADASFVCDSDHVGEDPLAHAAATAQKLEPLGFRVSSTSRHPGLPIADAPWYVDADDRPDNQWFELEMGIEVDGRRLNLLPVLLEALRRRDLELAELERDGAPLLLPLPGGKALRLPRQRLRSMLGLLYELYQTDELTGGKLVMPRLLAGQLLGLREELTNGDHGAGADGTERFRIPVSLAALAARLRDFNGISSASTPAGLETTLRAYQKSGLDWLQFLRCYDLGGILADDMGLGKTVQAIAHLLLEKEEGRADRPSLVVAPTSVVPNWIAELGRLAPSLRVLKLHGDARHKLFAELTQADVAITTYALLPRDAELLTAQPYHLLMFDESQLVKNPASQAHQAAGGLVARHRLCLTGTPLENHLGDLWAQIDLLMPGFLGDADTFRRRVRTPIEKHGDAASREALARRVRPLILRRTKQQVASELPPKSEIAMPIELEGAQRDLYETLRLAMHAKVRAAVAEKGVKRSTIVVLDALLKLRQACCDPRLVKLESARAAQKAKSSAKLEAFMELVPELVEEGRRILVFSQFTSMLALIEERLRAERLDFELLTGDTVDRKKPVARFQAGKVPVFLLSLKAGGVGLNLTAADTVIHYDPWWNPAVEDQATDRAHRIGQDKPVFVYKLIVKGSVEERMVALQAKKRGLAGALLSATEESLTAELTSEDVEGLFAPLE